MARRRFVVLLVLAALGLVLGGGPLTAPPASAATLYGHDISWPQCPTGVGGSGLPLPPTSTQFVVVGLTRGLPFTENPCLQSQVDWVRQNGTPAHGYTIPAFPTAAQLTTYGGSGPWAATTRAARLSNVGYAEAQYAVASLGRASFAPRVVWIDVEPRTAQPWPTTTTAQQRENRLVIEGMMRGLHDANVGYGLYSYTTGWNDITGSWRLPGVPVWATAGRLDYPTEAQDRCIQPSFSGGHVFLSQWYDDVRDYDLTCGTYAFTDLPTPPATLGNSLWDWNGDWTNDVLARWAGSGDLSFYPGNGAGGWLGSGRTGTGWNVMNAVLRPGDWNGDGATDVLARETSTGSLWLYPGNGYGGWLPRVRMGEGWNSLDTVVGPGDWNGDGAPDVLARQPSTGYLWLYPGNGVGGWYAPVRIGEGWNGLNSIVAAGDWNGDGAPDVMARDGSGRLWLYPGNGTGGWLAAVVVGSGWNGMNAILGVGDFNGDRTADLLARDTGGNLWLYPGNGTGGWLSRVQVGWGWSPLDLIL